MNKIVINSESDIVHELFLNVIIVLSCRHKLATLLFPKSLIGRGVLSGRRSAHAHVLRMSNDNMAVLVPDVGHGANNMSNSILEWLSAMSCILVLGHDTKCFVGVDWNNERLVSVLLLYFKLKIWL